MSTDITRGPKICPSCGAENSPNAAGCWLCFKPLGGAIQTTIAPSPGKTRLSAPPYTQLTGVSGSNWRTVGAVLGWVFFGIIAAFVTVFLVCSAIVAGALSGGGHH